ncbi:uncharacterized protein ASPGLDRAFT_46319 [Aspergillus glaucus CBS 516.65]|uniref:Uncharacterized protein n=1 Tax=Aspergillus glaucus CBS 516.65 TaxID=1160497 RepID=A0A1L9VN31_ASPGL|nr:hypothetical protein ASPGLDRAFT_46319 [Aspergillus glaucus CBS 516.65]OJJ85319.1 hypothetical protein ASPGLDRAFT_46319 [Aspergillus glaucus CBS 516.65]
MSPHDEGVQAQSSDLTQTPQTDYTQDNSEAKNDIQSKKEGGKDSQNSNEESNQNKSQGRDYERENDDGKDKVKEQEESNDEHDNNEGKEKSEQQSGEAKSGNGIGNGGSKHPKVSKEALEGPQSPAPTTKYDFDEEAKNDGSGKKSGKDKTDKSKDQKKDSDDKKDKSSEHKHGGALGHIKDKMNGHLGR